MRILTHSSLNIKGLISINEADENAPQVVVFCVPINSFEAAKLKTKEDFKRYFSNGISTKIMDSGFKKEIFLKLEQSDKNHFKFVASINSYSISFYLSKLNFETGKFPNFRKSLDISYFYEGKNYTYDFESTNFLILEPNWNELDELYRKDKIVFVDYE